MKKLKAAYLLIAAAAIAQGIMWINVFTVLGLDTLMARVGGVSAGIATVGMSTRSANFLPRVQSKRARQWGGGVLILFVVAEMIMLGNANYILMSVKSAIVAYGAAFVITLALVAGSMLDRSLIPAEKQMKAKPKQLKPKFSCSECAYIAKSQKALNGHMRKHAPPQMA